MRLKRYKDKVSGPLLDRIDIHVEVSPVEYDELSNNSESEKSRDIKNELIKQGKYSEKDLRVQILPATQNDSENYKRVLCF